MVFTVSGAKCHVLHLPLFFRTLIAKIMVITKWSILLMGVKKYLHQHNSMIGLIK